mmetsp:Transcript_2021/g.8915  ORF Transcript_2021/g.8915 Transcript_2021/m.8915 type:complete len:271 (-) Transcript_2021:2112-2924(-)
MKLAAPRMRDKGIGRAPRTTALLFVPVARIISTSPAMPGDRSRLEAPFSWSARWALDRLFSFCRTVRMNRAARSTIRRPPREYPRPAPSRQHAENSLANPRLRSAWNRSLYPVMTSFAKLIMNLVAGLLANLSTGAPTGTCLPSDTSSLRATIHRLLCSAAVRRRSLREALLAPAWVFGAGSLWHFWHTKDSTSYTKALIAPLSQWACTGWEQEEQKMPGLLDSLPHLLSVVGVTGSLQCEHNGLSTQRTQPSPRQSPQSAQLGHNHALR